MFYKGVDGWARLTGASFSDRGVKCKVPETNGKLFLESKRNVLSENISNFGEPFMFTRVIYSMSQSLKSAQRAPMFTDGVMTCAGEPGQQPQANRVARTTQFKQKSYK